MSNVNSLPSGQLTNNVSSVLVNQKDISVRLFVTTLNIVTLALQCTVITPPPPPPPQLIQLNSLFLTDSLGLGKKEQVPRGEQH